MFKKIAQEIKIFRQCQSSTSKSNQDLFGEFQLRSGCHVKALDGFGFLVGNSENVLIVEYLSGEEVPNSFEDVKKSESRDEWLAAMTEEIKSLVENKTWKLYEFLEKSLGGFWVFALKKDQNGEFVMFKARCVAKSFIQGFDSDYLDTFAPTAKLSSIRMFLPLAIHFYC